MQGWIDLGETLEREAKSVVLLKLIGLRYREALRVVEFDCKYMHTNFIQILRILKSF